jgi:hypothetical protein
MNRKQRFFIPRTKNFFNDIRIRKLLGDSGCCSLLLPISSTQHLDEIFQKFAADSNIDISQGKGVGGTHLSLSFSRPARPYEVNLCRDLLASPLIFVKRI